MSTLRRHAWPISGVMTRGGLHRLHMATPGPAVHGAGGQRTMTPYPRLIVTFAGSRCVRIATARQTLPLTLEPGDGLFLPAGSWLLSLNDAAFRSFTIEARDDQVRLLCAWFDPDRPSRARGMGLWCSTTLTQPLESEAMTYCRLLAQYADATPTDRCRIRLAELLLLKAHAHLERCPPAAGSKALRTYRAACDYLAEHTDAPISREDVAAFLRVHPNHVSCLFVRFAGKGLSLVLRDIRLERARALLVDSRLSVKETAAMCGFSDPNYFTRAFRRQFGQSPTQIRSASNPVV